MSTMETKTKKIKAQEKAIKMLINPDGKEQIGYRMGVYFNNRLLGLSQLGVAKALNVKVMSSGSGDWLLINTDTVEFYKLGYGECPIKVFEKEIIEAMELLSKLQEGYVVAVIMTIVKEPRKVNYRVAQLRIRMARYR